MYPDICLVIIKDKHANFLWLQQFNDMAIIVLCISSYQDWKLCTPFGLDEPPNNLSNKMIDHCLNRIHKPRRGVWPLHISFNTRLISHTRFVQDFLFTQQRAGYRLSCHYLTKVYVLSPLKPWWPISLLTTRWIKSYHSLNSSKLWSPGI